MTTAVKISEPTHLADKLNWLRAGVLGANDGIVSVAGLVMGVAGAQASQQTLLIAGLAGLVSGAISMAGGEYVSVSAQADTELAALDATTRRLSADPEGERLALAAVYRERGLSPDLADQVAIELSEHNALAAHAETRLGIRADDITSPWAAAIASFIAFALGALLPLVLMVASPQEVRVPATLVGVIIALLLTGFASARLGDANPLRPMARNVLVGMAGMGVTYLVGTLFAG